MIEVELQEDPSAPPTSLADLVARAVHGEKRLVVHTPAEAVQARRVAAVIDAIRAAR